MARYKVYKSEHHERRQLQRLRRWRRAALLASGVLLLAALGLTVGRVRHTAPAVTVPILHPSAPGKAGTPAKSEPAAFPPAQGASTRAVGDERLLVD